MTEDGVGIKTTLLVQMDLSSYCLDTLGNVVFIKEHLVVRQFTECQIMQTKDCEFSDMSRFI